METTKRNICMKNEKEAEEALGKMPDNTWLLTSKSHKKHFIKAVADKLTDMASKSDQQAMNDIKWISVKKQLPEIGLNPEFPYASDFILLSDGEFVYYGQHESIDFVGEYFIDSNGDDFEDYGIIIKFWMSLPNPPKNK